MPLVLQEEEKEAKAESETMKTSVKFTPADDDEAIVSSIEEADAEAADMMDEDEAGELPEEKIVSAAARRPVRCHSAVSRCR